MKDFIGEKVLITTSNWFFGSDGCEYRCVFGTLKAIHEAGQSLGFIPNRSHANWFIEIGNMVIMGCQVMYVLKTNTPQLGPVHTWNMHEGKVNPHEKPTSIYNADEPIEIK